MEGKAKGKMHGIELCCPERMKVVVNQTFSSEIGNILTIILFYGTPALVNMVSCVESSQVHTFSLTAALAIQSYLLIFQFLDACIHVLRYKYHLAVAVFTYLAISADHCSVMEK